MSGFVSGSCLFVSGLESGSCWVKVWVRVGFVSGACLVRLIRVWFVSSAWIKFVFGRNWFIINLKSDSSTSDSYLIYIQIYIWIQD